MELQSLLSNLPAISSTRAVNPLVDTSTTSGALIAIGTRAAIGAAIGGVIGYAATDNDKAGAKKGAIAFGSIVLGLNVLAALVFQATGAGWKTIVERTPICDESWGRIAAATIGSAAISGLVGGAVVGGIVGERGNKGHAILQGWKAGAIVYGTYTLASKLVNKVHPPAECAPMEVV